MNKILRLVLLAIALLGVAPEAHAVVGRPLTPVSYAGVARRTARRTSYAYGATGAYAYGAGVATGAAIAALPAGCAVGMPCGGVVYRPVYQGTTVVYVAQ